MNQEPCYAGLLCVLAWQEGPESQLWRSTRMTKWGEVVSRVRRADSQPLRLLYLRSE